MPEQRGSAIARRLAVVAMALLLAGCFTARPISERPPDWAQPVTHAALPNLHRVDDGLWRSALPEDPGPDALQALGIRSVLNLRRNGDSPAWFGAGVASHQVAIDTWHVSDGELLAALRIAIDPVNRPLLVHCRHGADRTGLVIAAYRVVVQGWTKDAAEREMIRGGYGYHPVWINLPRELHQLDVARMRRELGLPPTP